MLNECVPPKSAPLCIAGLRVHLCQLTASLSLSLFEGGHKAVFISASICVLIPSMAVTGSFNTFKLSI